MLLKRNKHENLIKASKPACQATRNHRAQPRNEFSNTKISYRLYRLLQIILFLTEILSGYETAERAREAVTVNYA